MQHKKSCSKLKIWNNFYLNVVVAGNNAVFFSTTTHLRCESSWILHTRNICSQDLKFKRVLRQCLSSLEKEREREHKHLLIH